MKIPCPECETSLDIDESSYPDCLTHCDNCHPPPKEWQAHVVYNLGPDVSMLMSEQMILQKHRGDFRNYVGQLAAKLWELDNICNVLVPSLLDLDQCGIVPELRADSFTLRTIIISLKERAVLYATAFGDSDNGFDINRWVNGELQQWMIPQYEPVRSFLWRQLRLTRTSVNKSITILKEKYRCDIAHFSKEHLATNVTPSVLLPELQQVHENLKKLYGSMFGSLIGMQDVTGAAGVKFIVESCKRNSSFIRTPERMEEARTAVGETFPPDHPIWEEQTRRFKEELMKADVLDEFNRVRAGIGLPPI